MSDLDVDGELLAETEIVEENSDILESINSCVLSSRKGIKKLDESIKKLLSNQDPKLIIIETSGSCHPLPLLEFFKNHVEVSLTGLFVLIDSLMLSHDFNYGENLFAKMQQNIFKGIRDTVNLLVEQIMFSSHLILTKADRIEKDKLSDVANYIQKINPHASTHSVLFGNLEIESLFELNEYDYFKVDQLIKELRPIIDSEKKDDQPYNLDSRVIKDNRPFHPERLWEVCHKYLGNKIYRSKGFFWLASRDKHSLLWNQAGGSISLEIIGSWRTGIIEDENHGLSEMEINFLKEKLQNESGPFGDRHCDLTVIGDKKQIDQFTDKLENCFLNEKEIKLWEDGHEFKDPWPKSIVKRTY